jgi:TRAP-type C4-dicarboxylate transport system permease small subunit
MSQNGINKKTGLEQLSDWVFMITGLMVLAITILVSYDVLMRYFLDEPQLFVDDLTSFLLVSIIFLGAGPVFYKGGHIRVDLLISHLKFKSQKKLRLITLIIGIIFLGIVTYQTMISTITAFQTGRVSAVMNYPLWIGMSFIPIGSILLLFYILIDFVNVFKEKSNNNKV